MQKHFPENPANEGMLPGFYGKHGFEREDGVILMGRKME